MEETQGRLEWFLRAMNSGMFNTIWTKCIPPICRHPKHSKPTTALASIHACIFHRKRSLLVPSMNRTQSRLDSLFPIPALRKLSLDLNLYHD